RNLQRIYNLTMNLLQYSKQREPKLEPVNLRQVVDDCIELIAAGATDKGVMVVGDIDQDMPPIPLDPDGIHQVLMNLLGNALDAVEPEKGLIRVVASYNEEAKQAVIE